MRGFLVCLLVLCGMASSAEALPRSWRDADLGQAIIEGVAGRESLWLRGETGKVVRFERATGERAVVAEGILDLLFDRGRLWALGRRGESDHYFVADLLNLQTEDALGREQQPGDLYLHSGRDAEGQVMGLVSWPGLERPLIVSQRGALPLSAEARPHRFAAPLDPHAHLVATDNRNLYAGYNRGEWGGGLRRVDLGSGDVAFVTAGAEQPCEGVLNPSCSPIVGLFPDRQTPGCLIVGSGIAHLGLSRGRVLRVCGSETQLVFSTPTPTVGDQWMLTAQPWPLDGLFEVGNGWIGTSRDRYFRSRDGRVEERPMPEFRAWGGVLLSDEQDGVLFLVASCCWGVVDNPTLYRAIAIPVKDGL